MGDICIAAHAMLMSMTRRGIPPWGNARNAIGIQSAMIVWEPLMTVPIKNSRPKDMVRRNRKPAYKGRQKSYDAGVGQYAFKKA